MCLAVYPASPAGARELPRRALPWRAFDASAKRSGIFDDFAVFPTASPNWMWSLPPPGATADKTNQPPPWIQLCHRRGKSMNGRAAIVPYRFLAI